MATELFNVNYHTKKPNMSIKCSYDCSRPDGERSKRMSYTFYFDVTMNGGQEFYASSNATGCKINIDGKSNICYVTGNLYNGNSNSITFETENDSSSGKTSLSINVWCHQGTYANPSGESNNCTASGGPYNYTYNGEVNVPKYNPYSPFNLSITSVSKIIKAGNSFDVRYNITKGTNDISWTHVNLKNSSGTYISNWDVGTSTGDLTKTIKDTSNLSNGAHYKISVSCSDGKTTKETDNKNLYTFTEPVLDNSVSVENTFATNANTSNKFTLSGINDATWSSDYENSFETRYRITLDNVTSEWKSLNNTSSWSRTESEMRELVPKAYDGKTCNIQFERYSPTPKWESTNKPSVGIILYYKPRMAVISSTVKYNINSGSGTGISQGSYVNNSSSINDIYISWSYDTSKPEAGYVQGYRVRLYNHKKELIGTPYYTQSTNIKIPKSDIPRIYDTYIDITPYFANDSKEPSDYWYYDGTVEKVPFIKLVSELPTPKISYPITLSEWINNDFRICFTLPIDEDYAYVEGDYVYENIEVKINSQIFTFSTSLGTTKNCIINNSIFSTTTLSHNKAIVVYPNKLSSFSASTSYSIQVRVKKKYGATDTLLRWTPWSDVVSLTIIEPTYSVKANDIIYVNHYTDAYDTVDRVRKTYGVVWNNQPAKPIKKSTTILASQYSQSTIMHLINETKLVVNKYADYDSNRNDIKFDKDNLLPNTFNEKREELITANKNEGNEYNGRNYIKFIYDRCLLLR